MNHVIFYTGVATDLCSLKNELNMLKYFKAMKLSGACYERFPNQPFKTCIHMSRKKFTFFELDDICNRNITSSTLLYR